MVYLYLENSIRVKRQFLFFWPHMKLDNAVAFRLYHMLYYIIYIHIYTVFNYYRQSSTRIAWETKLPYLYIRQSYKHHVDSTLKRRETVVSTSFQRRIHVVCLWGVCTSHEISDFKDSSIKMKELLTEK